MMMFPNSNHTSSGPYPYFLSSSSSYPPFTFLNPEHASSNNTFHHDPLYVPYIPIHHVPIQEALTNWEVTDAMLKQDVMTNGSSHYNGNFLTKKPAKKDRHSKIHTSQGLRDRRVRLSIDIARKFFDLQDTLGFDKASNTLEWLFNKSKKAIKELTQSKHCATNSFSSSSEGEVVSIINQEISETTHSDLQQQQRVDLKKKKLERAKVKETREKARARARERTSNKMCNNNTSTVQDLKKKCPEIEDPEILRQLRSHNVVQPEETAREEINVIEQSIVIKRKLKQSLMSSNSHHHNNVIPKEASFSNNNEFHSSFPNLSPNRDANNGTTNGRSNFCAIASKNLSTGMCEF